VKKFWLATFSPEQLLIENRIEMLTSWVDDYFKKYKIYYRTKPVNKVFPAGYAKTFKITKIERRKRK